MRDSDTEYVSFCLSQFYVDALPSLRETYRWPLPKIIPFDWDRSHSANALDANVSLRMFLARHWQSSDADERYRIERWYVRDWGGVRGNREDRLRDYARRSPSELVATGLTGIASWSKILTVRDPSRFAIYDARVVMSLNAVQIKYGGRLAVRFEQLPGRNKQLARAWSMLRLTTTWQTAPTVGRSNAYSDYLTLMQGQHAARGNNEHWHLYEMALFSAAERLADHVFP